MLHWYVVIFLAIRKNYGFEKCTDVRGYRIKAMGRSQQLGCVLWSGKQHTAL